MKKLSTLFAFLLCAFVANADEVDITKNFSYTWNSQESFSTNDEQVVVFEAVQWGGLACWLGEADWSGYEKLVVEFAEATTVGVQILTQGTAAISQYAAAGATSLEASFDGFDMTSISQVALQADAAGTIYIRRIYLVEAGEKEPEDPTAAKTQDILPKFTGTWNPAESIKTNDDGSKEYTTAAWGGMSAWLGGVDWSAWDALVLEFAEATTTKTKVAVLGDEDANLPVKEAEAGVTKIECPFAGYDVTNVLQVALQTEDATVLTITKAYLIKYPQAEGKTGDVNSDGKVDISDIVAVINHIAGADQYTTADVNADDKVDISDIVAIINIIAAGE